MKTKVVFIGIGNTLRGDDGVGPYIISRVKGYGLRVKAIDAGEVPENFIKTITGLNPKKVMLIDALDFAGKPGQIKTFQAGKIKDTTTSTHNMSLRLFSEHIIQLTGAEVLLIGIQPYSVRLGEGLSDKVKQAADKLIDSIRREKYA